MRIYLRPVREEDGKLIVKWRNASNVSNHCFNQNPITLDSNARFFHEHVETGHYRQYIVERIEEASGVASYAIATVYLKDVDITNRRCELCIFTSDDEEWNTVSQSIAVKMLLKIAFEELRMHKVYSYVFTRFEDEKNLLESAGFKIEAVLKSEAVGSDGKFDDAYRMATYESDI